MYRSSITNCIWPAVPTQAVSAILSQLFQLEYSQWLPPGLLLANQLVQLNLLLSFAKNNSPFYKEKIEKVKNYSDFQKLPLLTRKDLCNNLSDINCQVVPDDHLPIENLQTSGSTGQIVTVRRTALNNLMWMALNMRDNFWHKRDFSKKSVIIRANCSPQDDDMIAKKEGWGAPANLLFETGPGYRQPLSMDIKDQVSLLLRHNPHYLLTYPTNLSALLDVFESQKQFPTQLKQIRTLGETLTSDLRKRCKTFGLQVTDNYSAQEVGTIAIQCPVSGLYHIQAESLLVEVLNDGGSPCKENEIGRVVITDLHNFATPLIRYEIRDYAKAGGPCPCGRGLPTLIEILGRRRNMVSLPDGTKHWPTVGFTEFRKIAPIMQYQLVQQTSTDIEVRLVVKDGLSTDQEKQLATVIQTALKYPFTLKFVYSTKELAKTEGGKFEEFVSNV